MYWHVILPKHDKNRDLLVTWYNNPHKLIHSTNSATCLTQGKQNKHKEVHLCATFNTKYTNIYLVRNPSNFINVQYRTSCIHTLLRTYLGIATSRYLLFGQSHASKNLLSYVIDGTFRQLMRNISSTRVYRNLKDP